MRRLTAIALALFLIYASDGFAGGRTFSGGGRSSSGGRSFSTPKPSPKPSVAPTPKPSPKPSPTPKQVVSPSGNKSFSGGKSAVQPKPFVVTDTPKSQPNVSYSEKPKTASVDLKALRDYGTVRSREKFKESLSKGSEPKPIYTNKSGKTVNIDPKDKRVESVRKVDQSKWASRETRQESTYKDYYSKPPVFAPTSSFNDPFNPWFFMWLMERSSNDRALWVYHHKDQMDPERYKQLSTKDSELDARVKQLEREGTKKDSGYSPKGLDPDLQYDDDFVDAVVNPQNKEASSSSESSSVEFGAFFGWLCFAILIVLLLVGLVYGVFFYEY